jgi:hypothetical protein
VAAARKASRYFRSAICQQGNNPPPPSHRFRAMQSLSTLPRAGGFPKAPAPPPPCVFCSPTPFSACSQHTGSPVLMWCVRRPISTFQRAIAQLTACPPLRIIGLLPVFTWFPCAGSCGEPVTQTSRVPCLAHIRVSLPDLFNVLGVAPAA